MSIDISLIPQERIKDLVSTLDIIQSNVSTIDGKLTTTNSNLSTLQTNVNNNYTTLDNKIDSESSRIISIMDSNCVHKSGNETISGTKTFTGSNPIVLQNNSGKNITLTLKDSTTAYGNSAVDLVQATSNNFNQFLIHFQEGNKWCTSWKQDPTSKNIKIYFTGSEAVFAPTPPASDNSTKIATTAYVKGQRYIKTPNYSAVVTISNPYTAPADGIMSWNNSGSGNCTVNGHTFYVGGNDASNEGNVQLIVSKGDVVSYSKDAGTSCFVPFKS